MARAKFKMWKAPLATLQRFLDEGEIAIVAETGALVRRPDGQPRGVLEPIGCCDGGNSAIDNAITLKKIAETAIAGQTNFYGEFVNGMTIVTVNGLERTDFTIPSADVLVMDTALAAGDKFFAKVLSPFYVADTYTRDEINALIGNGIAVNFYTKAEVDDLLTAVVNGIEGNVYSSAQIDQMFALVYTKAEADAKFELKNYELKSSNFEAIVGGKYLVDAEVEITFPPTTANPLSKFKVRKWEDPLVTLKVADEDTDLIRFVTRRSSKTDTEWSYDLPMEIEPILKDNIWEI